MARKKFSKRDVQIGTMFRDARNRAQERNLPFNVTASYLRSIATNECPVFKTPLDWGHSGLGSGKTKPNGPQLDRIIPELGYVIGNVAFISNRANRIKDNGTMQEHYDIADWIWDCTVAKTKKASASFVSKRDRIALEVDTEYGAVPRARPWEDSDSIDDSPRVKISRDLGDRPTKSRSERVATGVSEVGASTTLKSIEDNGEPIRPYVWP